MNKQLNELKQLTTTLFQQAQVEKHPLFRKVHEGDLNEHQVKYIALQIYHVVKHFPRFLSAILTNMDRYELRMPLVENLFEEHGKMNPQYVHLETYKKFLYAIRVTEQEMIACTPHVGVIAYNRGVTDLCLHYHCAEGLGALGAIEEIVARVSPIVASFTTANYASKKESVVHFSDHETLDITHANEIYQVASVFYEGITKNFVEQGLRLGLYYHTKLYDDILKEAEKNCAIPR